VSEDQQRMRSQERRELAAKANPTLPCNVIEVSPRTSDTAVSNSHLGNVVSHFRSTLFAVFETKLHCCAQGMLNLACISTILGNLYLYEG
jgi:hypothetical protein